MFGPDMEQYKRVGSLPITGTFSVNLHVDCMKYVQDGINQEENGETSK